MVSFYGVVNSVRTRIKEIGIRMPQAHALVPSLGMIPRQALLPVGIDLVLGLGDRAYELRRFMASL